jgi:hypothetical protein
MAADLDILFRMTIQNPTELLISQLVQSRSRAYAEELKRFHAHSAREKKRAEASEKKQLLLLDTIGIKKSLLEREQRANAAELKKFLEEARPHLMARPDLRAQDGRYHAEFAGHVGDPVRVMPPYGAFLPPAPDSGGITSGWVFTDGSPIRIKDSDTGSGTGLGLWATTKAFTPVDVIFTFVPAVTASYEMTAVLAFHGFYVLRSDDGFFTSKHAYVDLRVTTNVHQYVDFGWKSFPYPLSRDEDNINEFDNFDRTFFFDSTAPLRAGDPVVVTAKIEIVAGASGSGSYAELNFADGTANYIQPLFLSVTTV